MATTVSVFNMKGGVGKTTLTVQLAWYMRSQKDKRVLVVDLDPQSNASHYLMGPDKYKNYINENRYTTKDVFEVYSTPVKTPPSDTHSPEKFIYRVQSEFDTTLDLIPASLKLSKMQKNPRGKEHALDVFLSYVKDQYDLILIDCPPTESMFTDASYRASQFVLVPMKPEFLSTIGLPLISSSLEEFKMEYDRSDLKVAGIVFNVVTTGRESIESKREIKDLAAKYDLFVFDEEISHSDSYSRSVREVSSILNTKYAKSGTKDEFTDFAEAFARRIGV
ncbi:ParA family protein [Bacillus sp. PS06]|uniref:ParA family protein n=1 Tax=Bacillus sp. PS06 TaxID=2764176 RepID=UPI00177E5234|nr:ParA family protein [Bacillus sp. PS06]MBD8068809.1 ParA family protein [Bacillus sp. PS06]